MNIKVITTKDQDDQNPRVNTIGPDPVLQQSALLPSGTVPEMILIHSDDFHIDLLVSMKSRLRSYAIDCKGLQGVISDSPSTPFEREFN